MKIAIAADHAGYEEKEQLKPLLDELGVQYEDLGTASPESVDYPNYARKVAEEVASGHVDQGLLVCGSGTGMAIVANKDRKSTRLNSSHSQISYAVFCLKKKKLTETPADSSSA